MGISVVGTLETLFYRNQNKHAAVVVYSWNQDIIKVRCSKCILEIQNQLIGHKQMNFFNVYTNTHICISRTLPHPTLPCTNSPNFGRHFAL